MNGNTTLELTELGHERAINASTNSVLGHLSIRPMTMNQLAGEMGTNPYYIETSVKRHINMGNIKPVGFMANFRAGMIPKPKEPEEVDY